MTFDEHAALGRGEANFFLQVQEKDRFMEREKMLHHVDGVLMVLLGRDSFTELQTRVGALESYLHQRCPLPDNDLEEDGPPQSFREACNIETIDTDPHFSLLKEEAWEVYRDSIGHGLALSSWEHPLVDLAEKVMELKIGIHSVQDPDEANIGQRTSIISDMRFDDLTLSLLMKENRGRFEDVLERSLRLFKSSGGNLNGGGKLSEKRHHC